MSDMALFEEGKLAPHKQRSIFQGSAYMLVDDLLSGGTSVSTIPPRISIKGAKFREMVLKWRTNTSSQRRFLKCGNCKCRGALLALTTKVVTIAITLHPACWSPDNKKPDAEVAKANPQAEKLP